MSRYAALLVLACAAVRRDTRCASSPRVRSHASAGQLLRRRPIPRSGSGCGRSRPRAPGDTICLRAADYDVARLTIRTPGSAGARITLRSSIPGRPRRSTAASISQIRPTTGRSKNLGLDGRNRWNMPSPMVSGDHSIWRQARRDEPPCRCGRERRRNLLFARPDQDIRLRREHHDRGSRIHDCGVSDNHNHGIYITATSGFTIVRDNWIYRNGDRGIRLYPAGCERSHNAQHDRRATARA